jgi:guanylate kinase
LYGTPKEPIEAALKKGRDVLMDLDVQGGLNLKKIYGNRAILVFIKPPSMESLRARLCGRNTDSPADIDLRLESAKQEMAIAEQYDHIIINHHLEDTVKQVAAIVESYGRSPRS